jgi:PKD repeat protein
MHLHSFAKGLRNPFRLAMDPNTKDKVKFHIGDVGASVWEEISVGGTDHAKANYGWPPMEGPCERNSKTACQEQSEYLDPIYYYEHTKAEEGGCVTGSAFVPDFLWPSQYKFLFIDFIYGRVYNLIEDGSRACRKCTPPSPGYRNETFMEHKDMVDMFFGPYQDTEALYIVSRSDGQNIRRIRFTSSNNRSPSATIKVDDTIAVQGQLLSFEGSDSSDPDGDMLTYRWDFGDGSSSTESNPQHRYDSKGQFTVTLTVLDDLGQSDQTFVVVVVGTPPTADIISPAEGDLFSVGEVLRLVGFGKDSNGMELNSSQFFWEVHQHHASHFHPFLDRTEGNGLDLFSAPEPEDFMAATNSFLKVIMYAVDSDGLTSEVSRIVNPRIVLVDIDSNPRGLDILVDEFRVETPNTITSWASHNLRLDVEDQVPYFFTSWSDGGARSHKMNIPAYATRNPYISANFTVDWSFNLPAALVLPVRNCSTAGKCGRCEGHCENDSECLGALVCIRKDGVLNITVPGCIGFDRSKTAWCTLQSIIAPTFGRTPVPLAAMPSIEAPTLQPTAAPPVTIPPISVPTSDPTLIPPVGIPDHSVSPPKVMTSAPMSFAPAADYDLAPFTLRREADPVEHSGVSKRGLIVASVLMLAAVTF